MHKDETTANPILVNQIKQLEEKHGYTSFPDPEITEKNYLTTVEAADRAGVISKVEYTLTLILHTGNEYLGFLTVDFDLTQTSNKVFLDFNGKDVLHCSVNDAAVPQKEVFARRRILVPDKHQRVGHNVVRVAFRNDYATDGCGLHHFADPEDSEEYVYSQFEPFAANKMLPCFDQPNLRATFRLITISPSNWVIVANELEKESCLAADAINKLNELRIPSAFISKEIEKFTFREFNSTKPISTYLFACIGGPYESFNSSRKPEEGYPPMRIFVRKSLKKYVEPYAAEFFKVTECGVKFYESIFNTKFPFSKLDQIYCPEYNMGAMENVGAVTYTEDYVFKDPPTEDLLLDFVETILHELSHMWFGDLVTMKWWNDLWLNESFATFISNLAMDIAPGLERYRAVWINFNKSKGWAYRVDQLPTTHPITAKITTTEDAENLFDGITYMKGASVLKQFYYLVSHDVFCAGLKEYFQTYQWKNTELKDFIGIMQKTLKASGSTIDLDSWVNQWLETKGANELVPKFTIKDGIIDEFKVIQKSALNGDKICRMHMMDVVLYDAEFNPKVVERVLIDSKEETIIESVKGMPAPTAVLLNMNDHAYAKIEMDEQSLCAFKKSIQKIKDDLTRMMIWRNFWEMVRDGLISVKEYLQFILEQLPTERNQLIMTGALSYTSIAISVFLPQEDRKTEFNYIFNMLIKRLSVETCPSIKKDLISYAIRFACDSSHIALLLKWLNDGIGISDATLSQSNRYSIIQKLYGGTSEEKQKLLARELAKDKSDEGVRVQRYCEAAVPAAENKEKFWKLFLDENTKDSDYMLFAGMEGFNLREQEQLLKPYIDKYFEVVEAVFRKRSKGYAQTFFMLLKPLEENEELLRKYEELNKRIRDEERTLKKKTIETIDGIKRTIKVREKYVQESIKQKMNVLIIDTFSSKAINHLRKTYHEVRYEPEILGDDLVKLMREIKPRVLIVRSNKVTKEVIDASSKLELIILAGSGCNSIDIAHCSQKGIYICNCPGKNSAAVAELTMGLMIAIDRRLVVGDNLLKEGKWAKARFANCMGLKGRTVGLLGIGYIGKEVARRCLAFDMKVLAWDPFVSKEAIELVGATKVSTVEELADKSDILSLHVPATKETNGIINDKLLSRLRPETVLINTARGSLVVEEDVLKRLENVESFWYGTDVFQNEPTNKDTVYVSKLAQHPRVVGSHHVGANTVQGMNEIGAEAVRILLEYETSKRASNHLNLAEDTETVHSITVKYKNKVGALAAILQKSNLKVEEVNNEVFKNREVCILRMNFTGEIDKKETFINEIEKLEGIISVDFTH